MDLLGQYTEAAVAGVPLVFVVMGLVEASRRFGADGKVLLGISLALGTIFGALYQLAVVGASGPAGLFTAAVYGLGLGVVASGLNDILARVLKSKAVPNDSQDV